MPESLVEMDPKRKTAIETSEVADNIGRSMINLARIPNGTYVIKYIRFSEPLSLSSSIQVLGTSDAFYFSKVRNPPKSSTTRSLTKNQGQPQKVLSHLY